jgi:hypothetical protein
MNCELARLRIALGAEGRVGEGADALAAHIQACPHCGGAAAFESALGTAMNAVPVPAGLHERLLKSASVRRSAEFRRAVGRSFAIAATVVAALGVGAGAFWRTRPNLDTNGLAIRGEIERETPKETVHNWLVRKHLPADLPLDFEYRWHSFHGTGELGEAEVPVVVFQRGAEFARVYIVKDSDAKLASLKEAQSSLCKVTILRIPGRPDLAYVVVHSTDTLDPFLKQKLDHLLG